MGKVVSEETKRKQSEANIGKVCSEETRRKLSEAHMGKTLSEEHRGSISRALRSFLSGLTPEENLARAKNSFLSDEAILRSARTNSKGPSEPEVLLGLLLEEYYPGKFSYNGDGRLGIKVGTKIPDYPSSEGKKEAISIMGGLGYFHDYNDDTEEEEYYRERGWRILVIWDYELYLGKALGKIKSFVEG